MKINKKGNSNSLMIVIILAVAFFGYLYFTGYFNSQVPSGGNLGPEQKGGIINGYYDKTSGQCWLDKDHPPGVYPIGQVETSFFQCCLNGAEQQIDCNNPATLLQVGVIKPLAIYQGQAGIFSVTHGVKLTNTGNVAITKGWIDSATWTPSNSVLTTAYSGMVGVSSSQAGAIPKASYRTFSSAPINLQDIGGTGTPTTYSLALITKGSATNLPDFTKTTNAVITVTKEEVGFDIEINLGA